MALNPSWRRTAKKRTSISLYFSDDCVRGASLLHLRHKSLCSAASGKLFPQSSQSDCAPGMMRQTSCKKEKQKGLRKDFKRVEVGQLGLSDCR